MYFDTNFDSPLFSVSLRLQFSYISTNLDGYACFCLYRSYFAKGVRYTCVGRINDTAVDFVYRSRTNVVVTWFSHGKKYEAYSSHYNKYYFARFIYLHFRHIIHVYMYMYMLQIALKVVHLISIIGNQGTLTKTIKQIITNIELLYHLLYLIFCVLGIFMHPFFYSVLVSNVQ